MAAAVAAAVLVVVAMVAVVAAAALRTLRNAALLVLRDGRIAQRIEQRRLSVVNMPCTNFVTQMPANILSVPLAR